MDETTGEGPAPESPVTPGEMGNYEGVSGGETTPQSGDPDAEAAQERMPGSGDDDEPAGDGGEDD